MVRRQELSEGMESSVAAEPKRLRVELGGMEWLCREGMESSGFNEPVRFLINLVEGLTMGHSIQSRGF